MPTFAPPYDPLKHQHSFLARQQKARIRKRKRASDSNDDDAAATPPPQASPSLGPTPRTAASAFHPVNRTDPYYIAGHPREHPLPPPPFPHAPVKEADEAKVSLSIEEELAKLNPPLHLPPKAVEDKSTSLKRRHLDNITAILHQSMRKGDWQRAHRAWGLLIRTEVNGRGIDIRKHGRWGIGAELLMRRGGRVDEEEANEQQFFTDEGFKLARSYYERLILQYPHTQHSQHHLNATAIYPALFNIWIYATQDRAKRARKALQAQRDASDESTLSTSSERRRQLKQILDEELDEASAIASRIDELVLSPPYDADANLLELRGMLALYLVDLHNEASTSIPKGASELSDTSADLISDSIPVDSHRPKANTEKSKAKELFTKVTAQGIHLPNSTRSWLENNDE